jgi:hypothetical protein
MIVRCRTVKGRELPAKYRGLYFTGETVFHVTPGQSYRVYEMALFNSDPIVLVIDDNRQPNWYPADLFDVEDGRLPVDWRFAFRDGDERGTQAVWGHPRLVNDPALDDSLANQDSDARVVFWREIVVSDEQEADGDDSDDSD